MSTEVTYSISGRGAKGGPVKSVLIFTVTLKVNDSLPLSKKDDLEVFVEGPEEVTKINIMGGERGTYHVGFTPNLPGQYWVDFVFKGSLANEPFLLPIKDALNKTPDVPYTGKLVNRGSGGPPPVAASATPARSRTDSLDQRRKEEERKREEEARKKAEEEARRKAEEEARRREEEEEARRKAEEEEARRREEEEEERRRVEEEEQKRKEEEEARRLEEEEEARRIEEEKQEKLKKEKEDQERKAAVERKKAEIAEKRRKEQEEKRKQDEAASKAAADTDKAAADKAAADKAAADKAAADKAAADKAAADKAAADKAAADKKAAAEKKAAADKAAADKAAADKAAADKAALKAAADKAATEKASKEAAKPAPSASQGSSLSEYAGHILAINFVLRAVNKRGEKKSTGGEKDRINAVANGEKITLMEDGGDGTYCFEYQCIPGENLVEVELGDKSIKGFPIQFRRKTMEEIEEDQRRKEEELLMEEEMRRQIEEEMKKQMMEDEMNRQLEEEMKRELERTKEKEEDDELERAMQHELNQQKKISSTDSAGLTESEKKLHEIEERKRKIAEKRAEIAKKREQHEALAAATDLGPSKVENARAKVWETRLMQGDQNEPKTKKPLDVPIQNPASKLSSLWEQRLQGGGDEEKKPAPAARNATPNKGSVAQKWLQSAHEEEKKDDKEKRVIDIPKGQGATKVASVWQRRLQGDEPEEKKVEKTAIDLGGQGATKVASLWQSRLEGKEPEPQEIKKTSIDIPLSASSTKALWQSKLEEKTPEPKIEKGTGPRRTGPSALASQWEQNANQSAASSSGAKKDIEELKQMMAKEREQLSSSSTNLVEFSGDEEEVEILLNFLSTHLKGETYPKVTLSASNASVWTELSDGIAMCKFFNRCMPEVLDVRVITSKVGDKRDKVDNWNLCIGSAKSTGCRLHDVKVDQLAEGDAVSIQKVIFQIAKVALETDIKMCEEYLLDWIDMELDDIAVANIDEIILKWVNGVVKKAGHNRPAKTIKKDFQDSFFYVILINEILGLGLDLDANELERAEMVLMASNELNKGPLITLQGILDGVYWQNYLLLANLLIAASEKATN